MTEQPPDEKTLCKYLDLPHFRGSAVRSAWTLAQTVALQDEKGFPLPAYGSPRAQAESYSGGLNK